MTFHLLRPEWLWALLPAALLGLLLWRNARGSGQWHSVIDPGLLQHLLVGEGGGRRRNLAPWLLLLWAVACLAAAGPSMRKIPQPLQQKQDALVLVLDLSYSMMAGDLTPSRIDRARQKLRDLLASRHEGQTALVAYAGDAHVVTPLTDDTPTIANLLPALDPEIMPVPGSNPAQAVQLALGLLRSAGVPDGRILLLTDGMTSSDSDKVIDEIRGSGATLSIMGVGTATGAPVPLPDGGFLKDDKGAIVMPRLDDGALARIASEAGGRYRHMQLDDSDLKYLLAESTLPHSEDTRELSRTADTWEDQGYLLVLALLPAALLLFRRGWIACLLPLLFLPLPQPARAGTWDDLWLTRDQQGQQALQARDYKSAAKLFEDRIWKGTAAYSDGDYEAAEKQFSGGDSADDWYNRGNALARQGDLKAAADAYQQSLQRKPGASDAKDNLALVEKLLKQQEQQKQQQQNQQQDKDDKDKSGKQGQNQQGQGQQDKDQQGQQQGKDQQQQSGQGRSQQDQQQDAGNQQQPGQDQQQQPQQNQSGQNRSSPGQQPQSDQQSQGQAGQDKDADEQKQAATSQAGEDKNAPGDQQASADKAGDKQSERNQAMEQWLRRVPDDPAGLLREKFRYESQQRQQQGNSDDDDTDW